MPGMTRWQSATAGTRRRKRRRARARNKQSAKNRSGGKWRMSLAWEAFRGDWPSFNLRVHIVIMLASRRAYLGVLFLQDGEGEVAASGPDLKEADLALDVRSRADCAVTVLDEGSAELGAVRSLVYSSGGEALLGSAENGAHMMWKEPLKEEITAGRQGGGTGFRGLKALREGGGGQRRK
jgi:hypothetical protein